MGSDDGGGDDSADGVVQRTVGGGLRVLGGFWEKAGGWLLPRDAGGGGGGYFSLLRSHSAGLGFCFLFVFASSLGQTFFISLFQPGWRDALGLTPGEIGAIYGGATLVSGMLLPFAGRWLDSGRPQALAVVVLGGLAAFSALAGFISAVWMLGLAMFGLRFFGQGLSSMLGVTSAAKWFEANRGKALSLTTLGYPAGEALLPVLATLAIAALGVRGTWLAVAAGCVVVGMPLALTLLRTGKPEEAPGDATTASNAPPRRKARVLNDPRFYTMLLVNLPLPFIGTGLIFFQATLAETRGWDAAVFPTGFMLFAVARALFSLSAGAWIDRIGPLRLLPVPALSLAFGLAWLVNPAPVFAYVYFIFMGLCFGASGTVSTATWTRLFGKERIASIRSLSSSVGIFTTAVAPFAFGLALDAGATPQHLILACAGLLLCVSWPASLLVRRAIPASDTI